MKNHAVIVLHDKEKVLFVKRSATKKSLPNIWAFPSGTIEEGENKEDTLVREAKEELGVDVKVEESLASVELPELGAKLFFIKCSMINNQPIIFDESEIQQIEWMSCEDFFRKFKDEEIGHGLIYLRKHPELWVN